MKKKILLSLVTLMILSLNACGGADNVTQKEDNKATEEDTQKEDKGETKDSEQEENGGAEEMSEKDNSDTVGGETTEVNIFYPDFETGELTKKIVKIAQVDAQLIWNELQVVGTVDKNTVVLGIEVDTNEGTIALDLNRQFGEALRSMGTAEEREIIDSIVNTFLEAYGCEKLKITEEGAALASGHKEYNDYLEKR